MSTPDNTDPDALLTLRDITLHQQSLDFATQELEKLTPEKRRAIAFNVLYFAASSRLALRYQENTDNDYARGYIQATAGILECAGINIKLTTPIKLD